MGNFAVKPVARPRPQPAPAPAPPPFPTVAVKIAVREGIFHYCATDGEQFWSGAAAAPTREAALLDVLAEVRVALDGPIRFVVSIPPVSPFWRHTTDLQTALNCLVERACLRDQPLMDAVVDTMTRLLPEPAPAEPAKQEPKEQLTVATDGSVRGRFAGHGWLAGDGRYRLRGSTTLKGLSKRESVLLAELAAINDAVRSLRGHPLLVLTDSATARKFVDTWTGEKDIYPPGFRSCAVNQHPLADIRTAIHDNRERLKCRWVRGHSGDPLNEGADALARLASRYVRGDSDLTPEEYDRRAAGIAASFAAEFARRG